MRKESTKKKTTTEARKAAREQIKRKAEKMTYRQIERFAHDLAELVMPDEDLAAALLVAFVEIAEHCLTDPSHVETICIEMRSYLAMMCLIEVDRVEEKVVARARKRWIREDDEARKDGAR